MINHLIAIVSLITHVNMVDDSRHATVVTLVGVVVKMADAMGQCICARNNFMQGISCALAYLAVKPTRVVKLVILAELMISAGDETIYLYYTNDSFLNISLAFILFTAKLQKVNEGRKLIMIIMMIIIIIKTQFDQYFNTYIE